MVHGTMGDYRTWRGIQRVLSKEYLTLSYSRRYNYPNPDVMSVTEYSILEDAQDLIDLIEAAGLGRTNIIAASSGAAVALLAAYQKPDIFKNLILIEPALRSWLPNIVGGESIYKRFLEKAWIPAQSEMQNGDRNGAIRRLVDAFNGLGAWESFPPAARASMLQNNREIELALKSDQNLTPITMQQAATISVPCLLVCGEKSPSAYRLISDELVTLMPQSRMITIPDARHAVWLDQPTKFAECVRSFLSDQ